MFIATLKGIFTLKDLPEEFRPFVDYKAGLEKKELSDDEEIAIISIKAPRVTMCFSSAPTTTLMRSERSLKKQAQR